MFWLLKVLIGRSATSLTRPFSYAAKPVEKPQMLTRVLIDFGKSKNIVGFIAEKPELLEGSTEDYKAQNGIRLSYIKGILDQEPIITPALNELAARMTAHYFCPLISVYQAMLPPSLKPRDSSLKKPRQKLVTMVKPTGKRADNLPPSGQKLLAKIGTDEEGLKLTSALVKSKSYQLLKNNDLVKEYSLRINRIKEVKTTSSVTALTAEQKIALQSILDSKKTGVLFEGVTGSGKTLVYLEAAKRLLAENKGSIILVPEIVLTDRVAALFKGVFADRCSILHSALSDSNKYDEYLRIKEGESQIVIGTRSAIFAPVKNLGLIVLDEEQSAAYKQDALPFYDARTVALMRAEIEKAKVVLASATPLIEDRAKAEKGLFDRALIPHKYAATPLVTAAFIDMSDLANISLESTMLSKPLINALTQTFARKEQALLFLNRRGFAPIIQCRKCHRTLRCPNCDIPLSLHRREGAITCHRCEWRKVYKQLACPHCESQEFYELGHGTERIEQEIKKLFPAVSTNRLDRDTTASDRERTRILNSFVSGEIDCLIGTEIIAKGHDFPRVTLTAALNADQSLALPTYLASENTFDLISQLVGRSGRADKAGSALIQTYDPLNKVLLYASRQDYEGFYTYEMRNRKSFLYPPYCYLCHLIVAGLDKKRVIDTAYALKTYLVGKLLDKRVNIYGPVEPLVSMVNKKHFRKIMIKYKDATDISAAFRDIRPVFARLAKGIEITIDIEPRDN